MPTNQFDEAVELQLDLFRAGASIQKDILRILTTLERDLVARAASANFSEWGRLRVNRQLAEVRQLIGEYYAKVSDAAIEGTSAIAEVSAIATRSAVSTMAVMPSKTMLESIASQAVIQGAAQGDWWKRQSADTAFRFSQAVRQGLAGGETNQRIISRVRGFLDTSRSNAAALVQTSVATIANNARDAVFAANSDIIKKYRAIATLDTHTCLVCAPLDGKEWEPDGTPIGHRFPFPNYPLHFNCRCLKMPIVFDGTRGGQRASTDGPVDANLTFTSWLERQSEARQNEILGKGRAALYRSGKITLRDLVNGSGSPLTLAALKQKYH